PQGVREGGIKDLAGWAQNRRSDRFGMDLSEAAERQLHLAVTHPIGGDRVAAQLFVTPRGIVFADVGWDALMHPGNQFHEVRGVIRGEGPWTIEGGPHGPVTVRVIDHGDPLARTVNMWSEYLRTPEGKERATRERCRIALEERRLLP